MKNFAKGQNEVVRWFQNSGEPSRQSSRECGDGSTKRKYVGIDHTSREAASFYVKLLYKFNIGDRWLCKNYSCFCQILPTVLLLPSGNALVGFCLVVFVGTL